MIVAVSWIQVYGTKMDKHPESGRNIWTTTIMIHQNINNSLYEQVNRKLKLINIIT